MIPEGTKIPEFTFVGKPLDKEQMPLVMQLIANSFINEDKILEEDDVIKDLFLSQVAIKRIAAYGLPFTVTGPFFAASMLTFMTTPGMVMGMLWIAKCYCEKTGKSILNIEDWCEVFPFGTPTEAECEKWWDSQKVTWGRQGFESDNMVDYAELWKCSVNQENT